MIEIVLKSKDFVVVNKPPGMPSQSDPSGDTDAMTACAQKLLDMGENKELYLIHRLDRVVGGLLVFARSKSYAAKLSSLVSVGDMTKEYYAVVEGRADGGIMKDYLYKDSTLGKAFVTDRKRMGVKEALLEYEPLCTVCHSQRELTLVKVRLITGRFHQIRAQFSSRKMPLIGDKKYGSRDSVAKLPALFAYRLCFEISGRTTDIMSMPDIEKYPWSLFDKDAYR